MRIGTTRFIAKEGLVNVYRNKLMSLASIIIVIATLLLFGFFLLMALNLEVNIGILEDQPQLEAFCSTALDDKQIKQVEEAIKNNDKIAAYEIVTKKQALEKMKLRLAEDASILDGYDENIFPVSFIIKLKDPMLSSEAVNELKKVNGVEKVSFSQETLDLISRIAYWIKFITSFMIVILLVVSVFIISNTIKLTVFARRREINIMKFIGATDWFIRWPFIVEGVIIGVVGAIIAFTISGYGYSAVETRFNEDFLSMGTEFFKLISFRDIWLQIIAYYAGIGILVGALGSFLSIRRYLRV